MHQEFLKGTTRVDLFGIREREGDEILEGKNKRMTNLLDLFESIAK